MVRCFNIVDCVIVCFVYFFCMVSLMTLYLFECKRKLLLAKCLTKYLCADIIEIIQNMSFNKDIKKLLMLNKAVCGIYSHLMYVLPGYMQHLFNRSWMIRYTKNMRIRKLNSYDTNIPYYICPFIQDTHIKYCKCDQCIYRFDYPRYKYLMETIKRELEKDYKSWMFYLLSIEGTGCKNIYDKDTLCGFWSQYNRLDNYKEEFTKEYNENLFLKNQKSKWMYLDEILGVINH